MAKGYWIVRVDIRDMEKCQDLHRATLDHSRNTERISWWEEGGTRTPREPAASATR